MKVYLLYTQDYSELMFFGIFKSIKRAIVNLREIIKNNENLKEEIFQLEEFILNKHEFYDKVEFYGINQENRKKLFHLSFFGSEIYNDLKIKRCIELMKKDNHY